MRNRLIKEEKTEKKEKSSGCARFFQCLFTSKPKTPELSHIEKMEMKYGKKTDKSRKTVAFSRSVYSRSHANAALEAKKEASHARCEAIRAKYNKPR